MARSRVDPRRTPEDRSDGGFWLRPQDRRPLPERLREGYPLLLIGIAFLAGAVVASVDRLRVFDSVYPLWILLALNGGVAAVAGSAALFVADPDRSLDEDPDVVRVPRAQWDSLLRRLEAAGRVGAPTPAELSVAPPVAPAPAEVPDWSESSLPSLAAAPALTPPAEPRSRRSPGGRRSVPPPPEPEPAPSASPTQALRRELDSLEVQGIAESALATAETLGPNELGALIRTSGPELSSIAERWNVAGPSDETADSLLARLLRELARRPDLPTGRHSRDEILGLAVRLDRLRSPLDAATPVVPAPRGLPRGSASPPPVAPLGSPEDEVEQLLRELEASKEQRSKRPREGGGRAP